MMECNHDEANRSVLGHCRACDLERAPEPMCACDVGLPQYCTPDHPPYA